MQLAEVVQVGVEAKQVRWDEVNYRRRRDVASTVSVSVSAQQYLALLFTLCSCSSSCFVVH